jgi:hypothetical protein
VYEHISSDVVSVGDIALADLAAIGRLQGRDGLPYPFAHTDPHQQHDKPIASVADRLDHGDLSAFREWMDAYIGADIWVACRVHHRNPDTRGRRILAYRAGHAGYLASQRSNDDVVEVSELSAVDLGVAIADAAGLTEPGTRPRIVISGYVGYFAHPAATDSGDDGAYSVRVTAPSFQEADPEVADEDVTAIAIIQSHWQPPRKWGVDWTKNVVACVQIDAGGDYIYTPDFSHAVPLTERFLSERIDRLIAEDYSASRTE